MMSKMDFRAKQKDKSTSRVSPTVTAGNVEHGRHALLGAGYLEDWSKRNHGIKLDWLFIPRTKSSPGDGNHDSTDSTQALHLALRILNLPPLSPLASGSTRRAKLNLRVTLVKRPGSEEFRKPEDPIVLSTEGCAEPELWLPGMKELMGYCPGPDNAYASDYHIVMQCFRIRGAQPGCFYLIEGRLQIQGFDHELTLPPFCIFYNPSTKRLEPFICRTWGESHKQETPKSEEQLGSEVEKISISELRSYLSGWRVLFGWLFQDKRETKVFEVVS